MPASVSKGFGPDISNKLNVGELYDSSFKEFKRKVEVVSAMMSADRAEAMKTITKECDRFIKESVHIMQLDFIDKYADLCSRYGMFVDGLSLTTFPDKESLDRHVLSIKTQKQLIKTEPENKPHAFDIRCDCLTWAENGKQRLPDGHHVYCNKRGGTNVATSTPVCDRCGRPAVDPQVDSSSGIITCRDFDCKLNPPMTSQKARP